MRGITRPTVHFLYQLATQRPFARPDRTFAGIAPYDMALSCLPCARSAWRLAARGSGGQRENVAKELPGEAECIGTPYRAHAIASAGYRRTEGSKNGYRSRRIVSRARCSPTQIAGSAVCFASLRAQASSRERCRAGRPSKRDPALSIAISVPVPCNPTSPERARGSLYHLPPSRPCGVRPATLDVLALSPARLAYGDVYAQAAGNRAQCLRFSRDHDDPHARVLANR